MAMLNNQRVHLVFRDSPKSEPRFFFLRAKHPQSHWSSIRCEWHDQRWCSRPTHPGSWPRNNPSFPLLNDHFVVRGHKWLRAWRIGQAPRNCGFPGSSAYPKAVHLVGLLCSAMFVPNTNYWYWLILVCLHIILQLPTSAYTGCTRCQSSAINLVPLFLIKHLHVWKNHSHNPKILSG